MCHLTMECDGSLEQEPPIDWLASQCNLSIKKFNAARRALVEADLLDSRGRVRNYSERQYMDAGAAARSSRYRSRKKAERDASRGASRVTQTGPDQNRSEQNRTDQIRGEGEPSPNEGSAPTAGAKILPPRSFSATQEQIAMLHQIASERGLDLEEQATSAGITWPLSGANRRELEARVSELKSLLKSRAELTPEQAKSARRTEEFDRLWAPVARVLDNPVEVASLIQKARKEDTAAARCLINRLHAHIIEAFGDEPIPAGLVADWGLLDRLPEFLAAAGIQTYTKPLPGQSRPPGNNRSCSKTLGSPQSSPKRFLREGQTRSLKKHVGAPSGMERLS
jgi:hypothetical protein